MNIPAFIAIPIRALFVLGGIVAGVLYLAWSAARAFYDAVTDPTP